jgi:hypothetical protein
MSAKQARELREAGLNENGLGGVLLIAAKETKYTKVMKQKTSILAGIAGLVMLALATPSFAAEKGKGKEITLTGEAKCAKCALKETDKCQNVIQVEKNGKTTTYYLTENDVSKGFHENVCHETKKVTATGTVKTVAGKQEFAATKIELAK